MSIVKSMLEEYKEKNGKLQGENEALKNEIKLLQAHLTEICSRSYSKEEAQLLYKLQKVKNNLNKEDLKMTGYNSYKNYSYFELKDFVPCTVKLMFQEGLSSKFFVKDDIMYLHIIDSETGVHQEWNTPLKEIARTKYPTGDIGVLMKDTQALQTYGRRTLWLQVLELVEPNSIEQEPTKQKNSVNPEYKLPEDLSETQKQVFNQIKKDFGNKIEFNKTTIHNKLNSMLNHKKIDRELYVECMEIIEK